MSNGTKGGNVSVILYDTAIKEELSRQTGQRVTASFMYRQKEHHKGTWFELNKECRI